MLAANQGDGEAQAKAAQALFSIHRDTLAVLYLKLGAENNSSQKWQAHCQKELAKCLEEGIGVPKSLEKAVYYYQLAADHLNTGALNWLGKAYLNGELGIAKSPEIARHYFRSAAKNGNIYAIQHLENLAEPSEKILEFYRKIMWTDEALFYAGLYLFKLGKRDRGVRYFIRGAGLGCRKATIALSICLEKGMGVQKCLAQANYFLQKVKKLNLKKQWIVSVLSPNVSLKEEVEKVFRRPPDVSDMPEFTLLREAKADGDSLPTIAQAFLKANQDGIDDLYLDALEGEIEAARLLGDLYVAGRKVPHSFAKAQEFYALAADRGDSYSQAILGYFYDLGVIERSLPKAIHFYEMAETKEDWIATLELLKIYKRRNDLRILRRQGMKIVRRGPASAILKAIHAKLIESKNYQCTNPRQEARQNNSIDLYKKAADQGDPYACWELADLLFNADNNDEAIKYLKQGAEATDQIGKSECQLQLGWRYRDGVGVQQSDKKALHYLFLSKKNNHPLAYRFLGEGYYFGKMGLKISTQLARKYAKMGAKFNDPGCLNLLGLLARSSKQAEQYFLRAIEMRYAPAYKNYILHLFSKGGDENLKKAIGLLKKIARITDWGAYQMGWCYENGVGVEQSNYEAFRYYALSAQADYPEGKMALARCYRNGIGTEKSESKAQRLEIEFAPVSIELKKPGSKKAEILKIFKRAERGSAKDQYLLGKYYLTNKKLDQAIFCFELAMKGGNIEATCELGKLYEGSPIPSPEKAVHFYSLAAHQDDIEAQLRLCLCYARGFGVEKSLKKAQEWLDAIKLNYCVIRENGVHSFGRINTSTMLLLNGYGLDVDTGKRIYKSLFRARYEYFDQLKHGARLRPEDHFELALIYEYGLGVEASPEIAFQKYSFAADYYPSIHFDLYRCYIQGIGVEPSYSKALAHLQKAYYNTTLKEFDRFLEFHVFDFGVDPSNEKIHHYFLKLLDPVRQMAEKGDAESQFLLGWIYEQDLYVKEDTDLALHYFKLAANKNFKKAIFKLGIDLLKEDGNSKLFEYFGDLRNDTARCFFIRKLIDQKRYDPASFHLKDLLKNENLNLEIKAYAEYQLGNLCHRIYTTPSSQDAFN